MPPPLPADANAPLQVKRLNWETHNPDQIDKTVWGRWKSTDHLEIGDLVESLELAQQFSTVKKKPGVCFTLFLLTTHSHVLVPC